MWKLHLQWRIGVLRSPGVQWGCRSNQREQQLQCTTSSVSRHSLSFPGETPAFSSWKGLQCEQFQCCGELTWHSRASPVLWDVADPSSVMLSNPVSQGVGDTSIPRREGGVSGSVLVLGEPRRWHRAGCVSVA